MYKWICPKKARRAEHEGHGKGGGDLGTMERGQMTIIGIGRALQGKY